MFQWQKLLSRMSPPEAKSDTKGKETYSFNLQTTPCVLLPHKNPSVFGRNQELDLIERVVYLRFVGNT